MEQTIPPQIQWMGLAVRLMRQHGVWSIASIPEPDASNLRLLGEETWPVSERLAREMMPNVALEMDQGLSMDEAVRKVVHNLLPEVSLDEKEWFQVKSYVTVYRFAEHFHRKFLSGENPFTE